MRVRQFIVVVIIGSMKGQMHSMGPEYACMPCKQQKWVTHKKP